MPTILVRQTGRSTLAGQVKRFESGRARLGRRADNDIVFDPVKDPLVSGVHAEIRAEGAGLVVADLGSSNGTFVNGSRISAPTPVGPGDVVSLGRDGPQLCAEIPAAAASVPGTQMAGFSGGGLDDAGGAAGDGAVGMQTLLRVVDASHARNRRKTVLIASAIGAFAIMAAATVVASGMLSAPPPLVVPDAAAVQRSITASTYVVMVRNRGEDKFRPQGTAWSVAPGRLATNCHVAELFGDPADGREMIARKHCAPGETPSQLRVRGITMHPGYASFSAMVEEFQPYSPSAGKFLRELITPYDVALLEIAPEDAAKQAPPIPLVPKEEVAAIEPGQAIRSSGFPLEGYAVQDWDRPTASVFVSTIARLNDEFFASAAPEAANMLMYQFTAVGGQSGSCVADGRGRAVGFVSAINAVQAVAGRDEKGGTCYGPRVDILHELLDGTAAERQAARDVTLRARFQEAFQAGVADPKAIMGWYAQRIVPTVKLPDGASAWVFAGSADASGTVTRGTGFSPAAAQIPGPGLVLITVVAKDHRASVAGTVTLAKASFADGKSLALSQGVPYFGFALLTLPAADTVTVTATLADASPAVSAEAVVMVRYLRPE